MDLKDFVANALQQILEAVKQAQAVDRICLIQRIAPVWYYSSTSNY